MNIPVVRGVIDRRILVNYRVDPTVLARLLPQPFRPQVVNGAGMAGVCLIRLKHLCPRLFPALLGMSSENAAHRIAVEWEQGGETKDGVFIPRRDTSSWLNALAGGRLFPGEHHHARFRVHERGGHFRVALDGDDRRTHLLVEGSVSTGLPGGSTFGSLAEASASGARWATRRRPGPGGSTVQLLRGPGAVPAGIRRVRLRPAHAGHRPRVARPGAALGGRGPGGHLRLRAVSVRPTSGTASGIPARWYPPGRIAFPCKQP